MGADRNESIMLDAMVHEELSGEINGAAMSVLNALKPVTLLLNFSASADPLGRKICKIEVETPRTFGARPSA